MQAIRQPMNSRPPTPQSAPSPPASPDAGNKGVSPRRVNSESLLAGSNELLIEHHGLLYRLRHTSLGKLILTK